MAESTAYFTDYPITALGDRRGRRVAMREIRVKRCTGSWCQIVLDLPGIELHVEVPVDRVYSRSGKRDRIPISDSTIHRINQR